MFQVNVEITMVCPHKRWKTVRQKKGTGKFRTQTRSAEAYPKKKQKKYGTEIRESRHHGATCLGMAMGIDRNRGAAWRRDGAASVCVYSKINTIGQNPGSGAVRMLSIRS